MDPERWISQVGLPRDEKMIARWLRPDQNLWGLPVLDCSQFADGMVSFTAGPEIANKYDELRRASGQELVRLDFKPAQRVTRDLTYKINRRPPDGPVFKSRVMEEKWDIYLYEEHLFFCRSWTGELVYRAATKSEPPEMKISMVERAQELPEKLAVRQLDFLVKSHLMRATALHPLFPDLGRDEKKQALHTFGLYGNKGRYGTLEETIGTSYYWNRSPLTNG